MATLNEKKTCSERMENFRRFVWNPETKLFMGRTLINWGTFPCTGVSSSFGTLRNLAGGGSVVLINGI